MGLLALSLPGEEVRASRSCSVSALDTPSQLTHAPPAPMREGWGGREGGGTGPPSGPTGAWEPKRLFSRGREANAEALTGVHVGRCVYPGLFTGVQRGKRLLQQGPSYHKGNSRGRSPRAPGSSRSALSPLAWPQRLYKELHAATRDSRCGAQTGKCTPHPFRQHMQSRGS